MPDLAAVLERLDQEGLRLTEPRQQVVAAILGRTTPFTSAELWTAIQERAPSIGRATVFRTLDLLVRLGILQRIHADAEGGRCHAYLACDAGHHHHLICNGCGAVTDFTEDAALGELIHQVERHTAFRIEGHRLELVGRCPACQARGS
ncbi:MAG TPA: Fur family transcriptional regulator [Chloroflexia bacterium]|nr:Fur family transcriptional regulator [Chloroflexia bacterium]